MLVINNSYSNASLFNELNTTDRLDISAIFCPAHPHEFHKDGFDASPNKIAASIKMFPFFILLTSLRAFAQNSGNPSLYDSTSALTF